MLGQETVHSILANNQFVNFKVNDGKISHLPRNMAGTRAPIRPLILLILVVVTILDSLSLSVVKETNWVTIKQNPQGRAHRTPANILLVFNFIFNCQIKY